MMHMVRHSTFAALVIAITPSVVGCTESHGLETAKVRGVVTLDGDPVRSGTVFFTPSKGRGARGAIQTDGSFVLQTDQPGDGATIGKHVVFIIANDDASAAFESTARSKSLVPAKYSNPETSGLSFEVKPNEQNSVILELAK